jgi:hypothetical protein
MRMRRTASLLLALGLTTALAACGDDDDSGGDALEDVSGSGSGTEESTEDTADADVDGEDSDIAEGFVGEGCVEFSQAFANAAASFTGAGGTQDLDELANFFEEAADDAPDDVADALRVFGEAYGEFANALEEAGIDLSDPSAFQDPEAIAVLTEAGEALSSPEVTEAQETIDAFVANNCES